MKKLVYSLVAMLFASSMMLTSCGSDNSGKDDPDPTPDSTVASVQFQNVLAVSPEVAKYFDITATYVNTKGERKVVKMSSKPIEFMGMSGCIIMNEEASSTLPASVSVQYNIERNEVPVTEAEINTISAIYTKVSTLDKKGNVIGMRGGIPNQFGGTKLKTEHLDSYVRTFKRAVQDVDIYVSPNGEISIDELGEAAD